MQLLLLLLLVKVSCVVEDVVESIFVTQNSSIWGTTVINDVSTNKILISLINEIGQ